MTTRYFTTGKFRYWHKLAVILAIALALLITYLIVKNNYIMVGAALAFIIAMPYTVLSIMEFVDRLNQ